MAPDGNPDTRPAHAPRAAFTHRALRLAGPYWTSPGGWRVQGATASLLLLTLAQVALSVWTNYWNRALFDALEAHSIAGVLQQVAVFALIFALTLAVTAAHLLVKRWLQLDWRRWLTERVSGRWMEQGRHYRLSFTPGEHDNPDGRIADDIHIFTETTIGLAHTLVFSLLMLGSFIDILWSLSGSLHIPGTALHVPGYLVWLAFVYAGTGTLLGWSFGRPLVRSTNALQTAEADFRFGLARVREHSEAIALLRGETVEHANATQRFADIAQTWYRQSLAYVGIVSFSTGYGALLPVFPILVAAPQYITGAISLGVLMQAAQAFQRLTSALSWPVDNLGDMARTRASIDRVLSLFEDMERLDAEALVPDGNRITIERTPRARLAIEGLCIAEADGRILLERLDLEIRRGERVLIAGDPIVTGALFKVLGELWSWGNGRVLLPQVETMLCVPQRPFLPEGTLRQALCYPQTVDGYSDATILRALECSGSGWLAPRLDDSDNWEQALPLRAQQRLGFARVLLRRPAWILLEEATDAFDPRGERLILEMLRHELPNSTLLTISFHSGLEALHDRRIVLNRLAETRFLFNGRRNGNGGSH
ncbi:MAG: ABC transporter ATP-binding protein/permease [Pseudomonadales bacterium]|jgi:putative ATP-binding cassette transporter|nr:ABC transporter ATP-binding protein/permease [Pseudomonadales bacterium]MCP5320099.1 ABC transporter ATP-binding protein/permease [Pseudomonadales bacterium]